MGLTNQKVLVKETRCAGFSLVELLVTIAIIILLTTLYWGSGSGNRHRKQQQACLQNLQKLFIAMEIYGNENSGKFPFKTGARTAEEPLDLLVPRYSADTSLFICPASKDDLLPSGEPLTKHKISYAFCMGRRSSDAQQVLLSDRLVDTRSKAAGETAFSSTGRPPGNNHEKYGGNFLFCDGSTQPSPASVAFPIALPDGVVLLNPKP